MSLPLVISGGHLAPAAAPVGGSGPGGAQIAQAAAMRPLKLSERLVVAGGSARAQWQVPLGGSWVIERAGVASDNPPNVDTTLWLFRSTTFDVGALMDYSARPDVDLSDYDPPQIFAAGEYLTAYVVGPDGGQFYLSLYGWQA